MVAQSLLAPGTLETLWKVSPATVTTQLIKQAGMRSRCLAGVTPLNAACSRFVGIAYTVRFVPLREDLDARNSIADPVSAVYRLVEEAPAGSVIMVDAQGITAGGLIGDIIGARLISRGISAFVCDGGMRDVGQLRRMDLPVFCRQLTAMPNHAAMIAADVQTVIGVGGVLVEPEDVVVGDEDGVVVIPRHLADPIAAAGLEQEEMEAWVKDRVQEGRRIHGLYPPDEKTAAEYAAWQSSRRGGGATGSV